jgi:hypothetical protein
MTVKQLERAGFDACRESDDGYIHVGCTQCQAAVIQGVACHEPRCPNIPRFRDEDDCDDDE